MAEYIEREALIDNLNHFAPEHYNALINMLIEKQPAADVVEVVRCGQCEHEQYCRIAQHLGIDGYCSKGERRSE